MSSLQNTPSANEPLPTVVVPSGRPQFGQTPRRRASSTRSCLSAHGRNISKMIADPLDDLADVFGSCATSPRSSSRDRRGEAHRGGGGGVGGGESLDRRETEHPLKRSQLALTFAFGRRRALA